MPHVHLISPSDEEKRGASATSCRLAGGTLARVITATRQGDAVPTKRSRSRPLWQGEYVLLYDRDDYWFRKCVVCGRSFEGAAARVQGPWISWRLRSERRA